MPKDKGFRFRASALSRLSVKLLNSEALNTDEFPIKGTLKPDKAVPKILREP